MPQGFYRELIKEISLLGFAYWKPAKGSHEKWRNSESNMVLIIPHNLDSRHTANDLLKDAGSTKKF
jgi:predicted RNA binding protein YcfA (HicA-like mRNA interferase family)